MRFVMTFDQFTSLKQKAEKNDAISKVNETGTMDGTITTHDVELTYHYDGTALNYEPTKKFTLASRIASDRYIEQHVDHIIMDVLQSPDEVVKPLIVKETK